MFWQQQKVEGPLNICFVSHSFPLLGQTSEHGFIGPVARGLVALGHKVTVLCWSHPEMIPYVEQSGIRVFFLKDRKGYQKEYFQTRVLEKFTELHRETPFHLVHGLDDSALYIGEKKRQLKVAVTYGVEATQMSQVFSILGMVQETWASQITTAINVAYKFLSTYLGRDRKLLNTADGVFVTSQAQSLTLERYYLYPEAKTFQVPYGLDVSDLSPKEKNEALRQKLNLPEGGQTVVTVSDMTELSELRNLLLAFEKVAVKRPQARLIIVGNGPLFKRIEYEMLCLALSRRVIFTGPVSEDSLADYISLGDIYVSLSARTSGFEPSLLEAMAQKKIVIASEMSPISTLVEDGLDGFLIRPADVLTLIDLMLQVFAGEIDNVAIGEQARKKVLQLFDSKRMVKQTLGAYYRTMNLSGLFKIVEAEA